MLVGLPASSTLAAGGILDPSFGSGGKTIIDATDAGAVAVRGDGKIAIVGGAPGGFGIVLLNADGSPDTSFSGDGHAEVAIGGTNDFATAVTFDAAGKIVVAGAVFRGAAVDFGIVRVNDDGSLDSTFDGDGKQQVTITPGSSDLPYAVAVDGLGRIVVGGLSDLGLGGSTDFALIRLTPLGTLDPTFDADGIVTTAFGAFGESIHGLAIQPDGKVVAAGEVFLADQDFGVARYLENGSLDPTFDSDGKATVDFGSNDRGWGVDLASGGRIVVGGYSGPCCTVDFVAARLTASGSPDPTFGGDGKSDPVDLGGNDIAYDVVVDASDRVVLAGSKEVNGDMDWGIARLAADGTLDTGFATGGIAPSPFTTGFARAFGAALQADGKVVVAGGAEDGVLNGAGVARYLSDGAANAAPAASFTVTPPSGTTATSFSFDGSGSSDPDGDPLTYAWSFGDGGTATGSAATHTYALPGTYTATLTVNDGHGHTDATTRSITVSPVSAPPGAGGSGAGRSGGGAPTPSPNRPPVAGFEIEPPAPNVGSAVAFDASGSSDPDGDELTLTWAFGDGEVATGRRVTHVFSAAGTYDVRLTVSDGRGGSSSASRAVLVAPARRVGLAVSRIGAGVGTVSGGGLACGRRCTGTYVQGTPVVLQAVPATGHVFKGWGGACNGIRATCVVTMSAAQAVTARFEPRKLADPFALVVEPGDGGAVATWEWGIGGAPVDCGARCVDQFRRGSTVRLVAVPVPGYRFAGWDGACAGQGSWCVVRMSQSRQTKARFVRVSG